MRDAILKQVRIMLSDETETKRDHARRILRGHITHQACPAYVCKHVIEFLEREQDFRAYLTPYYYKALRDMGITAVTQSFYRGFPPIENVRVAEYGFKV